MGGPVSSPRLVGRDDELARLRDAVADAAAGRARLVLVSGDAGIGKSRLVAELLRSPGPAGARVLAGGCLAIANGGLPYAPLTEALRNLARELEPAALDAVLGPARGELARLLPDLAPAVRIGVHHGEATRTATGWAGREVHVAARLGARAEAGEILASAETLAAAGVRSGRTQPVSLPGLAGTVAVAPVPWR